MVFGDNVRARRAARALPRTPTRRGKGKGRGEEKDEITHTARPAIPPQHEPNHKDTTLNQQCCDSKHKTGRREEQDQPPRTTAIHNAHTTCTTLRNSRQHTRPTALPPPRNKHSNARQERSRSNTTGRTRSKDGIPRHTTTPAIQRDHHANGRGTPARGREGHHRTARPSLTMPPHHVMPPHHPR